MTFECALEDPVEQAERVLADFPLCDRCLGRLFGMLGRGLSNEERGRALKLAIVMRLHARIREGDPESLQRFRALAPNLGQVASRLYKELYGEELGPRPCYLCGGLLEKFIEDAARRAFEAMRPYNVKSFLIGVRVSSDYVAREEDLRSRYSLKYGESLKSELKREIGKLIQSRYGLAPDFARPEAVATVEFPGGSVEVSVRRLIMAARYHRANRWTPIRPMESSPVLDAILKATGGSYVSVKGLVRDEMGVRVLGAGVPVIVEVSRPLSRDSLRPGDRVEANGQALELEALEVAMPRHEELLRRTRTYRCIILSETSLSEAALSLASSSLLDKEVRQRVGTHEAIGRVKGVSCRKITDHVAECLISSEERIYVRELVTGHGTSPSLAEALGSKLECVLADLVEVS